MRATVVSLLLLAGTTLAPLGVWAGNECEISVPCVTISWGTPIKDPHYDASYTGAHIYLECIRTLAMDRQCDTRIVWGECNQEAGLQRPQTSQQSDCRLLL